VALEAERRLAAILSADVAGYSRLMAEDEAGTIRTLTAHREAIASLVQQHHGRVVDSPGDNLLAEFPNALDTVQCAVETQRVLQIRNQSLTEPRRMLFRVGVHLGDITTEGGRVYGDGVNIAARLEGLAEPGGVCISGEIHGQVERKLDLGFEDLGEQSVKNIARPVRVYRVMLDSRIAEPEALPRVRSAVAALVVLVLVGLGSFALWQGWGEGDPSGGTPMIAVLRFCNLSGDPDQEYFSAGLAEDLITRLSGLRSIPVISRNSSFMFDGCAADMSHASQELGARYLVEGSVRKGGNRLRVSAQLIDATSGAHVWAKRYDRELQDVFGIQDEIVEGIVGEMYPELLQSERLRAARDLPRDPGAYDLTMRGWWHYWSGGGLPGISKEDNARARSFFERAIEVAPSYAPAWRGLARTHAADSILEWTDSPAESLAEEERAARGCIEADSRYAECYLALSAVHQKKGELDDHLAAVQRAVSLDPNNASAQGWMGVHLAYRDRPEEAREHLERAMRLDPLSPEKYWWLLGFAYVTFAAERYATSAKWAKQSAAIRPLWWSYRMLAASYAQLGRMEQAEAALCEALLLQPGLTVEKVRAETWTSVSNPDFLARYIDGLRKAGLPEE
jgi:TolB-like protein/class 3 adenylate cyclase